MMRFWLLLGFLVPLSAQADVLKTSARHIREFADASPLPPQAIKPPDFGGFLAQQVVKPELLAVKGSQSTPATKVKGCISIDGDASGKVPRFKLYCDGMETMSDEFGFFSFPVLQGDEPLSKYRLIVCNKVKHAFKRRNTIDSFGVIPDMNYRCFKFVRSDAVESGWQEMEKDLKKKSLKIPPHSIVLVLNPLYFARLEPWKADLPNDTIKLPRIVLIKDAPTRIKREANKSLLYSLDGKHFHGQVRHRSEDVAGGLGERKVHDID